MEKLHQVSEASQVKSRCHCFVLFFVCFLQQCCNRYIKILFLYLCFYFFLYSNKLDFSRDVFLKDAITVTLSSLPV